MPPMRKKGHKDKDISILAALAKLSSPRDSCPNKLLVSHRHYKRREPRHTGAPGTEWKVDRASVEMCETLGLEILSQVPSNSWVLA